MTPKPLTSAQTPRPHSLAAAPGAELDLDAQIEALEQRLVAREAWLSDTAQSLARRAQHAATPAPWVLPVVGVAVVLWVGWRWWHRDERAQQAQHARMAHPGHAAPLAEPPSDLASLPWAGLTAIGWPLLPAAWRGRVSPAAATAVVSTVLTLVRRLFRRRRP